MVTLSPEAVLERLREVEDPELPVSIVDLGMVADIRVGSDGTVAVDLVPTFLGCPAQHFIEATVAEELRQLGAATVAVRWSSAPWSLDAVSPRGREQLRGFGIAVPDGAGGLACPHCGSASLVVESEWGSTLCRKLAYCGDCQSPSEIMKGPAPTPVTLGRARARAR